MQRAFGLSTCPPEIQPAPSGFYEERGVEPSVRKFGYPDNSHRPDRLNFGGRHVVGVRCPPTGLTMRLAGFDAATGKITDANREIALVSDVGEVAAGARRSRRFTVRIDQGLI